MEWNVGLRCTRKKRGIPAKAVGRITPKRPLHFITKYYSYIYQLRLHLQFHTLSKLFLRNDKNLKCKV